MIQFATRFLIVVFSHAKEKTMFDPWTVRLKKFYESSPEACRWLLGYLIKDIELLKQMLLSCPTAKIRSSYASILVNAIKILAPLEKHYAESAKLCEKEIPSTPPPSHVIWFIETLFSMLKATRRKNCDRYFFILAEFAKVGVRERKYLLKKGLIQTIVNYYLGRGDLGGSTGSSSGTGGYREKTGYTYGIGRYGNTQLGSMIELLATLITGCKVDEPDHKYPPEDFENSLPEETKSKTKEEKKSDKKDRHKSDKKKAAEKKLEPEKQLASEENLKNLLPLKEADKEALFHKPFIFKLIREDINPRAVHKIAVHYCWESKPYTKLFLDIFVAGLNKVRSERFPPYLRFFDRLININDSLLSWRIDQGLISYLKAIQKNIYSKESVERCVNFLVKMAETNSKFRKKLFKQRTKINEILQPVGYRVVDS